MFKRVVYFVFAFLIVNGLILIITSLKFPFYQVKNALREGGEYVFRNDVRVKSVFPDSPAGKVGIKKDDVIVSVDSYMLKDIDMFPELVNETGGRETKIRIFRNGKEMTFDVIPIYNPAYKRYTVGLEVTNSIFLKMPFYKLVPKTIIETFQGRYDPLPLARTGKQALFGLLYGCFFVLVGIGGLKLKKWALVLYVLLGVSYLITFIGMPILIYQQRSIIAKDLSFLIPYIFALVTVPSSYYFVRRWKYFK